MKIETIAESVSDEQGNALPAEKQFRAAFFPSGRTGVTYQPHKKHPGPCIALNAGFETVWCPDRARAVAEAEKRGAPKEFLEQLRTSRIVPWDPILPAAPSASPPPSGSTVTVDGGASGGEPAVAKAGAEAGPGAPNPKQ